MPNNFFKALFMSLLVVHSACNKANESTIDLNAHNYKVFLAPDEASCTSQSGVGVSNYFNSANVLEQYNFAVSQYSTFLNQEGYVSHPGSVDQVFASIPGSMPPSAFMCMVSAAQEDAGVLNMVTSHFFWLP